MLRDLTRGASAGAWGGTTMGTLPKAYGSEVDGPGNAGRKKRAPEMERDVPLCLQPLKFQSSFEETGEAATRQHNPVALRRV